MLPPRHSSHGAVQAKLWRNRASNTRNLVSSWSFPPLRYSLRHIHTSPLSPPSRVFIWIQLRDAISRLAQVPAEGASEHPHLATLYCSHCLCASSCRFPADVRTWRNDELSKLKSKPARARGTSSFPVMGHFALPTGAEDKDGPRREWSSDWDEYVGSFAASGFDEPSWLEPNLRDGRARPAATMEAIVLVVVCVDGSGRTVLVRSGDGHGPSSCGVPLPFFGQRCPVPNVPATEHGIWSSTLDQALAGASFDTEEVRHLVQESPRVTGDMRIQGIGWTVTYVRLDFGVKEAQYFADTDTDDDPLG